MRFCLPSRSGWLAGLASKPTGDVLEAEDGLSLNNSCGTRDVCRLPQAIFLPRPCFWLASVLQDASCKKRAPLNIPVYARPAGKITA